MASWIVYVVSGVLSLLVMLGIAMMSKPRTAKVGNILSASAMTLGIIFTLLAVRVQGKPIVTVWTLYPSLLIGALVGGILSARVKMIQMPQMVALFNGLGGGASALVGLLAVMNWGVISDKIAYPIFNTLTGYMAMAVGMITLIGSLVAAGKLHRLLPQRPQIWPFHSWVTMLSLFCVLIFTVVGSLPGIGVMQTFWMACGVLLLSSIFGLYFSIRVGGADMPITISLLNSFSGVAGAIAGMAIGDVLLVAVGGIVGASGLLLTQIMCKAMNRSLLSILLGGGSAKPSSTCAAPMSKSVYATNDKPPLNSEKTEKASANLYSSRKDALANAKKVIIVPGYGMALAQAQYLVKQLADTFVAKGAQVKFAIHPVAGRMPGHMNVLLAEANVEYDNLYQMEEINDQFEKADVTIVIGANDVLNPAARDAEGTPIYGMPVLNVDRSPYIIICNYDLKPGYAGVENPLYSRKEGVSILQGDAKESLQTLLKEISESNPTTSVASVSKDEVYKSALASAKKVIIVPGYGMALAQAQHNVKKLADVLKAKGVEVKFAIHPVAGRMPGHMNVLLAEANVGYDELFQMEDINDEFSHADLTIVVGANDVMNPAARDAEGTPIYGMPVLNVDASKHIIICNYDLKPGYAGVENPLYTAREGVTLLLGDAKDTIETLVATLQHTNIDFSSTAVSHDEAYKSALQNAKDVIIVPGYGMALAQAQHLVKQFSDTLVQKGVRVRYAIHPVAGRMPGHMNVLLAEANVDYDELFQMEDINDDFAKCDVAIVVGANDVMNPAARDAEGTPIYGMPVLNVDASKHIIICNYDLKPGYAGVDNPLYTRPQGVTLMLGDAKESVSKLIDICKNW